MIIGKVIGNVVSTRKHDMLVGYKFMLVQHLEMNLPVEKYTIAVDTAGAGIGDVVLVATGSAARLALQKEQAPVDASIVGIVD